MNTEEAQGVRRMRRKITFQNWNCWSEEVELGGPITRCIPPDKGEVTVMEGGAGVVISYDSEDKELYIIVRVDDSNGNVEIIIPPR